MKGCVGLLLLMVPVALVGQGWRADVQSGLRTAAIRGLQLDTIARGALAAGAAPTTPDGLAVFCPAGSESCTYYRPGPVIHTAPFQTQLTLDAWGLGMAGLRVRLHARHATDLTGDGVWPGTTPALQLTEGYAEYARRPITVRLGRSVISSRLGWHGLDGAHGEVRLAGGRVGVGAWAGWGLAQAASVFATSASVNPLNEYQPRDRQLVAGGDVTWRLPTLQGRVVYQREVDPAVDYFLSERVAGDAEWQARRWAAVRLGVEYDLAAGEWGSTDAVVAVRAPGSVRGEFGVRRYRPYFPLWTVWGAFSPSPYSAVFGSLAVGLGPLVRAWAHGEYYWFDPSDARTPLVSTEDAGWRWNAGAEWQLAPTVRLEGQGHAAFGPGAASLGADGHLRARVHPSLHLSFYGGRLVRPLEVRYQDVGLWQAGGEAAWRLRDRVTATGGLTLVDETRDRPDAAAVRWNHVRAHVGLRVHLGRGADHARVPPAVLAMPDRL